MENRPPEDTGGDHMRLRQCQFGVAPPAEAATDGDSGRRQAEAISPPSLAVDAAVANLIHRRRWRAVVKAKISLAEGVTVHRGLRRLIDSSLDGREPATTFYSDLVEVNFGVYDNDEQGLADAHSVAGFLSSVVDPLDEFRAQVDLRFVDTSDIDPYLPEDRRTLR